jgi:LysR family transcriptional regulator for metE and metH
MNLEIRHLRLIEAVAEEGSLTKAVDRLFLTQSALSHQLKEIETQLGSPVFHRVNKKLVLTGVGKIVLKLAKRILKEMEDTEIQIRSLVNGDTGAIRLATECYTCYHWLPPLLKQFHREFPNIEVSIHPEFTSNPIRELLKGKIDLAITSLPLEDSNVVYRELFRDEMVALVSADHSWAGKEYVNPKDFTDESLIIYEKPLEDSVFYRQFLEPDGIRPKKLIPIQLTEASIELVKAKMGIKVMARWAITPYFDPARLATVKIGKKGLNRTWYVAMLKKSGSASYLDFFIEHLCLTCLMKEQYPAVYA